MNLNSTAETTVAQPSNRDFDIGAFSLVAVLFLSILTDVVIKRRRWVWLPESVATMAIGALTGGMMVAIESSAVDLLKFNQRIFFFALLPPIIFEAGYSLKKSTFFHNLYAILAFAIVGTIVSTLIVGYSFYYLQQAKVFVFTADIDPAKSLWYCLMFGAIVSATDPVATLTIYSSPAVDAPPLLYSLVFGEAVLNDAVAIVLLDSFGQFLEEPNSSIGDAVGLFFANCVGATAIGFLFACLLSFITKRFQISAMVGDHPEHFEIGLALTTAMMAYYVTNALNLSGIVALFFCAIGLKHYFSYNISESGRHGVHHTTKTLAHLSEILVYLFLGMHFVFAHTGSVKYPFSITMIGCTLGLCIVSRAAQVFPISLLLNLTRKKPIPFKMQVCMWFAGLRGACAFALVFVLPTGQGFQACVAVLVMFTTLVFGTLTEPLMRALSMRGIDLASAEKEQDDLSVSENDGAAIDSSSVDSEVHSGSCSGQFRAWFKRIDDTHLKVWFGGRVHSAGSVDFSTDQSSDGYLFPHDAPTRPQSNSKVEMMENAYEPLADGDERKK